MKTYKIYFAKSDTPFRQDYQESAELHSCWFRLPYKKFLGHQAVKIKRFGIFTIYDITKNGNERR